MKNLIIKLNIRVSETESTDIILERVEKDTDIDVFGEEYAMEYYPDAEEMDGEYYSDGGGRAVSLFSIKEVTDEEFDVLKKYI